MRGWFAGEGTVSKLAFSPDGATLYVVPSGSPDVLAYPVEAPGKIGASRVLTRLAQAESGPARGGDGLAVDSAGNLYLAVPALKAIQVVTPAGKTLGMIYVPEGPSNADFGGKDLKTLYITARTSVYAVQTEVTGHRFGARALASVGPDPGALVIVGGGGAERRIAVDGDRLRCWRRRYHRQRRLHREQGRTG